MTIRKSLSDSDGEWMGRAKAKSLQKQKQKHYCANLHQSVVKRWNHGPKPEAFLDEREAYFLLMDEAFLF